MNYDAFSSYYDIFTNDIDYKGYSNFIISLFEKYDRKPTLMLDLACGTGNFSFEFANKNIDVIGVDPSEGMLSVAKSKQKDINQNPLFLMQSAENLELFGTVNGAICMLDSLNHITNYENFFTALKKVSLFLEKDRLFIFDLNTPYKHKNILGNNTFVRESENCLCVWQNEYIGDGIVNIYLDIFCEDKNGKYDRFCEDFSEIAYSSNSVNNALNHAGFEIVDVLDNFTYKKPNNVSERLIYIVRKK